MAIRVIYMIEEFTNDGDLVFRRFARNKKVAQRIAKDGNADAVVVRELSRSEMDWVTGDIEG